MLTNHNSACSTRFNARAIIDSETESFTGAYSRISRAMSLPFVALRALTLSNK